MRFLIETNDEDFLEKMHNTDARFNSYRLEEGESDLSSPHSIAKGDRRFVNLPDLLLAAVESYKDSCITGDIETDDGIIGPMRHSNLNDFMDTLYNYFADEYAGFE